ncbi:CapA family protein [Hamadaea sp. NPDC050747]|uniref:CapA family protein n=1 Tax=Hamadaea sp. NPDC050747 TaxID=3155789 RepID=UPI0033C033FC
MPGRITVFLCGDVMTGRGVDQILPSPGDPQLWEPMIADARDYVRIAELVNGPIPRPVPPEWLWGDALPVIDQSEPAVRIVNLETAITADGVPALGKEVLYRMHPGNAACLTAARIDLCVLANNHILDFGTAGLVDTLAALRDAGIAAAGAGPTADAAWSPVVIPFTGGRLLVLSAAMPSSGVPSTWAADSHRPGLAYLPESAGRADVERLIEPVARIRQPGDLVVLSVHWGSNWGDDIPRHHIHLAHELIDAGVDVIHGHSSHHLRRVDVYQGKLILYGCGDFIDDYEGIGGYGAYRDDLRVAFFPELDITDGRLTRLKLAVFQSRRMRLVSAAPSDVAHIRDVLRRTGTGLQISDQSGFEVDLGIP